jgi:alpha-tubulin suppressor-like RCC1 family protein
MGDRFPGGVISKTPPTVTGPATSGPFAGEGGSASGVWTLAEQLGLAKAGVWPKPVLPRELYAWGLNTNGQLGQNNVISRSSPVQVGALTNWAQVSQGDQTTVSIKTDGTLWAWGSNEDGQIGNNVVASFSSPVQVGSLTNWRQVSNKGGLHTAAVKTDNTLWTWGRNSSGQLGQNTGTLAARSSPVQVGALTNWQEVSAGRYNTAAITTDNKLYVWGRNQTDGAVGDNTVIDRSSPVQIGSLTDWSYVSCGNKWTLSLKTNGTIWAWGSNNIGQIGDNTTVSKSSPVQIGALTNWASISAGDDSAASIKINGTLWLWGNNYTGCLGDGTTVNRSSPVQVGALTNWAQVSAGNLDTACITTAGTLFTWGWNPFGQLGQNNTISRSSPVQVGALTTWGQVAAGLNTVAITKG